MCKKKKDGLVREMKVAKIGRRKGDVPLDPAADEISVASLDMIDGWIGWSCDGVFEWSLFRFF